MFQILHLAPMPLSDLCNGSSSESDSGNSGDDDSDSAAKKTQRQQRTSKARMQRLLNRAREPAEWLAQCDSDNSSFGKKDVWADHIQKMFFTPDLLTGNAGVCSSSPFEDSDRQRRFVERARAVMSLMVQVFNLLVNVLTPSSDPVSRILDCVVLDDCSCRIRAQGDTVPIIYTVMNTVQTCHIQYGNGSCNNIGVPTPFLTLPSQRTEDLHSAYCSGLLLSSRGVGCSLKHLQEATQHQRSLDSIITSSMDAWKCHVMIGDALPTNTAVFRLETALASTRKQRRQLSLRMRCQLHQLCLVRRPIVLAVDKFWTTLVRLGHLYEQHSFKKQFALALVQVLKAPGNFQRSSVLKNIF